MNEIGPEPRGRASGSGNGSEHADSSPDGGGLPLPGPATVRRVAVLRANGVGDFVLGLPALEALRAAYPAARITYLGLPWHVDLLSGRPGPWDEVDAVPSFPGVSAPSGPILVDEREAVRAFVERHRAIRYDLAVQLHGGGAHSNRLVGALGAALTVGGRDRGAPPLDRWVPFRHLQHETMRNLEIVRLAGAPPVTLAPALAVTARDRRDAAQALAPVAPNLVDRVTSASPDRPTARSDRALVALHPGAGDPRRRLPVADFAAVADALTVDGHVVLVVGDDRERALGAGLGALARRAAATGRLVDLTGRLPLAGLLAVLASCQLLIGNDSGPRHLAGALGTPTVGIYWCGNVVNAGELARSRHRIVTSFQTTCPECGARQEPRRCAHDPSFVAGVPITEIIEEARGLLNRDWEF